jgi:hypothetical protein
MREMGDGVATLSVHQTSQGLVCYRRWPDGNVSVELLGEPAKLLAWVSPRKEPHG